MTVPRSGRFNPIIWAVALVIVILFSAVSYRVVTVCEQSSFELLNKLKVNLGGCKTDPSPQAPSFVPYSKERQELVGKVRASVERAEQTALRAREAEREGDAAAASARSAPNATSVVDNDVSVDGSRRHYEGQWFNGVPYGFGVMSWSGTSASMGEHFSGQFIDGRRALGVFSYPPIAANTSEVKRYEGEWAATPKKQNGNWNGFGVIKYRDGSAYRGEVVDGERQGYGALENAAGEKIEGRWVRDKIDDADHIRLSKAVRQIDR
jgi:hypothetical protein